MILVSVGPLPGLRSDLAAHLGASGAEPRVAQAR